MKSEPVPDFAWYSAESRRLSLPTPRCPFASVHACPRYYQSLSLLGSAGCTGIPQAEDDALKAKWEKHPLWPATAEQATSISGGDGEKNAYDKFCPEVAYDTFGLFATFLGRHVDEIDRGLAAEQLAKEGAAHNDPRWIWAFVTPQHYSHCPLYSPLIHASENPAQKMAPGKCDTVSIDAIAKTATRHAQRDKQFVFISYAHADSQWLAQFERHLKPFLRGGNIDPWSDQRIKASQRWHDEIQAALAQASAAVLLVSPAFLASDYIADHELPVILKKAAEEGLKIFSIILSPCAFNEAEFKYPDPAHGPDSIRLSVFQAINSPSKTLKDMRGQNRDRKLHELAKAVAEAGRSPRIISPLPASVSGPAKGFDHYRNLIDQMVKLCSLRKWPDLIWEATKVPPCWKETWYDNINKFYDISARTVWPGSLPVLERALKHVAIGFYQALKEFDKHCRYDPAAKKYQGRQFYSEIPNNPYYDKQLEEYEVWISECGRRLTELAKALNWFTDVVRAELDPNFFLADGYFSLYPGEAPPHYTPEEITRLSS